MKNFVSMNVLLQLLISIQLVHGDDFEFGDMLVFPQTECGIKKASAHYAIYVDDVPIKGKKDTDKLFHMIISKDWSGCTFTPMSTRVTYTKHNYLDEKIPKQSQAEIIKAIETLNHNCGEWSWTNTCEHIATSVRYGEANAQCNQHGTWAGSIFCPLFKLFSTVKSLPNASRHQRAAAEAA